jgi:hypothetical protein
MESAELNQAVRAFLRRKLLLFSKFDANQKPYRVLFERLCKFIKNNDCQRQYRITSHLANTSKQIYRHIRRFAKKSVDSAIRRHYVSGKIM